MADTDPIQTKMVLLPPHKGIKRCERYETSSDRASNELVVNVLVDPRVAGFQLSHDFVRRAIKEIPSIVYRYENDYDPTVDDMDISFDLVHKGFRTTFKSEAVDYSCANKLGADLPPDIDVLIGEPIIKEIKLAMRQSYLSPSMDGLRPVFRRRHFDINTDLCFVLMPFTETWSNRIWTLHIKPTVERAGMKCSRADDIFIPGIIIEDIWSAINTASIIVADLTGKNPNVFYELGLAHVIGTPTILLSQDHEIPAFDTAHYRQIKYQDNTDGCKLLQNQLYAALKCIIDKTMFP